MFLRHDDTGPLTRIANTQEPYQCRKRTIADKRLVGFLKETRMQVLLFNFCLNLRPSAMGLFKLLQVIRKRPNNLRNLQLCFSLRQQF